MNDKYFQYILKSNKLIKSKEYNNAILLLKKAIDIDFNQYIAYGLLGSCYIHIKDYHKAISNYILSLRYLKGIAAYHIKEKLSTSLRDAYKGLFFEKYTKKHHQNVIDKCEQDLQKEQNNILLQTNLILCKNILVNLQKDCEYITDKNNGDFKLINSLQEFYDIIQEIQNEQPHIAFRGYNRSSWSLTPSLYRNAYYRYNSLKHMNTFLESFKTQTPARTHLNFKDYTDLEFLSLMQHYGTPTPLLDWTLSAEIALFFSLDMDKNTEITNFGIPCITILTYKELTTKEQMKERIKEEIYSKEDKKVNIFMPNRLHSRTDSQHSIFTYHKSKGEYSYDFITLEDDEELTIQKLALMPQAVKEIKSMLKSHQITPDLIYQDLQKLGEKISSQNHTYTDPIAHQFNKLNNNKKNKNNP